MLERVRHPKSAASRKRLSSFIQQDDEPVSLTSLPQSLRIERERLEVRFRTLGELAEAMYAWPGHLAGKWKGLLSSTSLFRETATCRSSTELKNSFESVNPLKR